MSEALPELDGLLDRFEAEFGARPTIARVDIGGERVFPVDPTRWTDEGRVTAHREPVTKRKPGGGVG